MNALWSAFEPLIAALDRAEIRYAVGGSWASAAFGEPGFTNDVDIVADFTPNNLRVFLEILPKTFYVDAEQALEAVRSGRAFNAVYMPAVLKFDLFPAASYPLGSEELDRAIVLEHSGLSSGPTRFLTKEDILLAKLNGYRLGGGVSEVQWRDIEGIIRTCSEILDHGYLERGADKLGVRDLLDRCL